MVFSKIKEMIQGNEKSSEKYEVLYYKFSQAKVKNNRLKEKHAKEMIDFKAKTTKKAALDAINVFLALEDTKIASKKMKITDPTCQSMLVELNKTEKLARKMLSDLKVEEITASEQFYDPEIHEIAKYEAAKGMAKGMIVKTAKKGFKFNGKYVKKPRVVVTK